MRRLLLTAGYALSLAAVAALASGATYGFFSATSSGEEHAFSTGTVTLSSGTSGSCAVSNLLPTSPPSTCTLQATYSGSAPAYLAVDVLVQTQPGAGGTALYDPSGSGGLQVTISSANPTVAAYSLPVTPSACPPSAPASSTCFALQNALVATTPFTSTSPVPPLARQWRERRHLYRTLTGQEPVPSGMGNRVLAFSSAAELTCENR